MLCNDCAPKCEQCGKRLEDHAPQQVFRGGAVVSAPEISIEQVEVQQSASTAQVAVQVSNPVPLPPIRTTNDDKLVVDRPRQPATEVRGNIPGLGEILKDMQKSGVSW